MYVSAYYNRFTAWYINRNQLINYKNTCHSNAQIMFNSIKEELMRDLEKKDSDTLALQEEFNNSLKDIKVYDNFCIQSNWQNTEDIDHDKIIEEILRYKLRNRNVIIRRNIQA